MGSWIVVTGGAGFLGSHLCERLIDAGERVLCVDSLLTGRVENVDHLLGERRFRFLRRDVRGALDLDVRVSAVFHLASPASPRAYLAHPIATLETGSVGTGRALELARSHRARFLLASTSEVYGDPEVHPQPESYRGNVSPTGPRSVYDEAKRYAEALTAAYNRAHGVDVRIARIFNTYGPRMSPADGRAIPNFITQALQDRPLTVYGAGEQTRSFCHVDDLIEGLCSLLDRGDHDPVNLGNPEERSVLGLARLVIAATGSRSPIEFQPLPADDPRVRRPDISRARALLAWEPTRTLEQGLPGTIAWFRRSLREEATSSAPSRSLR